MQLPEISPDAAKGGELVHSNRRPARRLVALTNLPDAQMSVPFSYFPLSFLDDGTVYCVLAARDSETLFAHLLELSLVVARDAETRGALLLHGALAERNGIGVILAAPGGTGKSTASERLLPPWRSLCDDTTLVVRDGGGNYWAHPWPTWSRFVTGGPGGTWNVPCAVKLQAVFFLSQSEIDQAGRTGSGRAATWLIESAQQVGHPMTRGMPMDQVCALHLERFDNACALARAVPAHLLHLSLTGAFWLEIERVLIERGNSLE